MMDVNGEPPTPQANFMGIQPEMRSKIYNHLNQIEVSNLMQTNKELKMEIISLYEHFTISIDDRTERKKAKYLLNLKAKQCEIRFAQKRLVRLLRGLKRQSLLKYPKYLRNLKFDASKISAENFHLVMQDCYQYLNELSLTTNSYKKWPAGVVALSPSDFRYSFSNIQKLEIQIADLQNLERSQMNPENDIFLCLMDKFSNSECKLTSLKVRGSFYSNEETVNIKYALMHKYAAATLKLIVSKWTTLQEIELHIEELSPAVEDPIIRQELRQDFLVIGNLPELEKLTHLQNLQLIVNNEDSPIRENSTLSSLWTYLAMRQRNLQRIGLKNVLSTRTSIFYDVCRNNFETLSDIFVTFKCNQEVKIGSVDLKCLENCSGLQKLTMTIEEWGTHSWLDGTPTLTGLTNLPDSVKKLHLEGFLVHTSDFEELFSRKLLFLEKLHLSLCGTKGDFGMVGSCMEKVFGLPAVLRVFVKQINFSSRKSLKDLKRTLESAVDFKRYANLDQFSASSLSLIYAARKSTDLRFKNIYFPF